MIKKQAPLFFALGSVLILATLSGCDTTTSYYRPDGGFYELRVSSIDSMAVDNDEVRLGVTVQLPSPCYQYDHRNVFIQRNDIDIVIYGRRANTTCAQVVTSKALDIGFEKPGPGTYKLHFRGTDSTTLDTTLIVEKRGARGR